MGKYKRNERMVSIVHRLLERPSEVISLGDFAQTLGAARSTISEDISLVREVFEEMGLGEIQTIAGAAGGVVYFPILSGEELSDLEDHLCRELASPDRVLPGGFLYMTDLIFAPKWASRIGRYFATRFRDRNPDCAVTMETKGIPVALMTAHSLNIPLILIRRDSRVTEGSSVSINYVSGSSRRIQTMSLPRRALSSGKRVLVIDDFMRGGGTARGVVDLVSEFSSEVVGIGVIAATAEPSPKLVSDFLNIVTYHDHETVEGQPHVVPGRNVPAADHGC